MLTSLHANNPLQRILALLLGIIFGFLLQKGGVTHLDVIINQLRLTDFTVVKIMLSAVITGMIGVHFLKALGMARLHPKPGSFGSSVIGGLIFGVGFGVLGYCPGTIAGAVGQGFLDALTGGIPGILIGAELFAVVYPKLNHTVLNRGNFGELTLPELLNLSPWVVVASVSFFLIFVLILIEKTGW
ncbi:MAG: YeeE/YedE thiosulfate transporter family protein [Desulfobacterales bacterium]|nr:YeeE/YedE thiosulfate transporter family protein [Desulfobacterales bacterium]MDD4073687.1 YeeE/YedE thiosulfate transporter family protein [Desulfobacterales bacterium]MDD4392235.1 YeeE/YedE thiosulfate transporter family protein [Desulfobacterales bacterium]